MAFSLPTASRNAAADAVGNQANGGTIAVYTGTKPADPNTAATGTLLATVTLAATAFGAAGATTPGQKDLAGVPLSSTAAATGTAGWFRMKTSGGATVLDGTAGVSGSGAELILNSTSLTSGGTFQITSGSITMPA